MPPIIVDFTSLMEKYFCWRPDSVRAHLEVHRLIPYYLRTRLLPILLEHYFAYSYDVASDHHLWDILSEEDILAPVFDDGDAFMALSFLVSQLTEDIDAQLKHTVNKVLPEYGSRSFSPSEAVMYEHYLFDRMLSRDPRSPSAIFVYHNPQEL